MTSCTKYFSFFENKIMNDDSKHYVQVDHKISSDKAFALLEKITIDQY